MTEEAKFSLRQLSDKTGVPIATLRAWEKELGLFGRAKDFGEEDVAAVRAVRRFLEIGGATLHDARNLIELVGPQALVETLGRTPARASNPSPARMLQDSVRRAAQAGLFGAVMSEVAGTPAPSGDKIVSLDGARVARLLDTTAKADRKRG